MLKRTLAAAAVMALVAAGCGEQSTEELGGKRSPTLTATDNGYFRDITMGNLAEIQSSQMELQSGSSEAVKRFAQRMVQSHQQAGMQANDVAKAKDVVLPTMLDSAHKDMLKSLDGKSGADLDKAYVQLQIDAHQDTINKDEAEGNNGTDPDVKDLAQKLLPTLQDHLTMAKQLKQSMMPN